MKETFYFPHDYNAIQDSKMLYLLSQCGLEGIGAYWIIIEILHQQTDSKIPYQVFQHHIKMYYALNDRGSYHYEKLCSTLVESGLLKRDENYVTSERVISNKNHREVIRNARSIAGKASANKRVRTNVERRFEQNPTKERKGKEIKDNTSDNEEAKQKLENFEYAWSLYPRKFGRKDALRHFMAQVNSEEDWDCLLKGIENYKSDIERLGTKEQYIKHGSSFFNQVWVDWGCKEDTV